MTVDQTVLVTIFGMAMVTYATRASGYFLVRRLVLGPFARRFMDNTPGAMFAALCAPYLVEAGLLEWIGAVITVSVMRISGNLLLALLAGVGSVALLRALTQAM